MKRRLFVLAWAAALSLVLSVSLPTVADAQTPKSGGTLRVAMIGEPPTIDAHWATATIVFTLSSHIAEALFTLDDKYNVIPMLADSYEIGDKGKTYTIKIRQGVPFHNGKEMTSADVVASLNRWGKVATVGKRLFSQVESFKALDKYTIEFRLKGPSGIVLSALANTNQFPAIYPKEVIDEAGDGQIKEHIGTGPYRFVERLPDRHIKLARFDTYAARTEPQSGFGGKKVAYTDEILFFPVPEMTTRIAGIESGDYHIADWIAPDSFKRLKENPRLEPIIVKPKEMLTAIFNKKAGPFTNKKLRQAVLAALDMDSIMKGAYGQEDFYRLDNGLSFKEQVWYTDVGKEKYNQKNKEQARLLLKEAGYKGEPIRWMCSQAYDWMYKSSLVIKQQLEDVGMKVDLQVLDWASVVQRRNDPSMYDVFVTGMPVAGDPSFLLVLGCDWPGWTCIPAMEALMAEFVQESQFNKRLETWKEIQKLCWEEVPFIKIGDFFILRLKDKSIKGDKVMNEAFFWNVWIDK